MYRLLYRTIDIFVEPLKQGMFPNEMKLAKVVPIYKNENEQHVQNYRPLFLFVYNRLSEEHNILYDRQFGFRKSHSTNHAIITLVEKVSKPLDTGRFVVGIFLGLKKAFDTGDHASVCLWNKG